MKRPALLLLAGLSLLALLPACDPGVEGPGIPPDRLVAVSSFISPQDSLLTVYVIRGQAIGGKIQDEAAVISDAVVELSDAVNRVPLGYNPTTKRYETPAGRLPIRAESTYFLTVTTFDRQRLTSQCRVPVAPTNLRLESNPQSRDIEFEAIWEVPAGNPYALLQFVTPPLNPNTGPFIDGNVRLDVPGNFTIGNYLTDSQQSGRNVIQGRVLDATRWPGNSLRMEVANLEASLHRYLTDYRDLSTWNNNTDGFIPSFREPKALYSNIEGGIGIFAAYNRSELVQKIK